MLIISILFISISLGTPWWHFENKYEVNMNGNSSEKILMFDFKNDEIQFKGEFSGDRYAAYNELDNEYNIDWDDFENFKGEECNNIETTFQLIKILTIISLILAIIALISLIFCSLKKFKFKIGWVLCLLSLLFSLIAPIYLATSIEDACYKDNFPDDDGKIGTDNMELGPVGFITSDSASINNSVEESASLTTYPTTGWFMAIIGIIFNLIVFIHVTMLRKSIYSVKKSVL